MATCGPSQSVQTGGGTYECGRTTSAACCGVNGVAQLFLTTGPSFVAVMVQASTGATCNSSIRNVLRPSTREKNHRTRKCHGA